MTDKLSKAPTNAEIVEALLARCLALEERCFALEERCNELLAAINDMENNYK
jgi:hypothetical protein